MPLLAVLLGALLSQQKTPDTEFKGLAAKCGSEIPWLESLTEAQKESKASGKPIAWWVTKVEGSPMDRKTVLEKYMPGGPVMMAGVIEVMWKEFVPLRLSGLPAIHAEFGIRIADFIEPGMIFLGPDLKVIHRVDRMTTYSEDWLVHLL